MCIPALCLAEDLTSTIHATGQFRRILVRSTTLSTISARPGLQEPATEGIVSARRNHGPSRHATHQNRPEVLSARELEVAAFIASALINRDTTTATVITEEDS